jgi:hypothetical protein
MVNAYVKSEEMFIGIVFICLLATIMCSIIAINNIHLHTEYQQVRYEAQRFSLRLSCTIENIVTRERRHPSWTSIESKFLISIQHPLNNNRTYFEVISVPISLFTSVVS